MDHPPGARDPWMWLSLLAVVPLVAHAWGAPLGEPVAEDFDFLYHQLFSPRHTLLDGGGSMSFWRPLAHQVYYQALGSWIVDHPAAVAALHTVALALATLLLYRALRRVWPGPWAALAASFPLLSESTRAVISWPSQSTDLGVWLFTALAVHEAAARRLATTLLSLLAALLCKEVAVIAALLIPWMPGLGPPDRRTRMRWTAATLGLVAVWAAAYAWVRHHAGLSLPHGLENELPKGAASVLTRLQWAWSNTTKALFSLPAVYEPRADVLGFAGVLLVLFAAGAFAFDRRARARLREALPWVLWGGFWFCSAAASLVVIYPFWVPARSIYGSLGFGVMWAAVLGAAGPLFLAGILVLRLAAFAMSPGPPRSISDLPPSTGAFMDFEHLSRLQRLMREARSALKTRYPRLPAGAEVGQAYMPRFAQYAFGGSRGLQVWYRDSSLRWVRMEDFLRDPKRGLSTIVEFEPPPRQIALLSPEALRCQIRAKELLDRQAWRDALVELDRADSIAASGAARFRATEGATRAMALVGLGQNEAAEREALRAIALWPAHPAAHAVLGFLRYKQNRLKEAQAELVHALGANPNDPAARALLSRINQMVTAPALGYGTGERPPTPPPGSPAGRGP